MRTKEQNRKYNQADYAKHSEKRKQKAKEYYHKNKETVIEKVREYRDANRDEIQEKGRKYYRRNIKNRILNAARTRAKKAGMVFDITLDDIILPKYCPLLGVELKINESRTGNKDNSFSLDRIDSKKGYEKNNVWIISHKANTMKSSSTIEEFRIMFNNWKKWEELHYDLNKVAGTDHE